MVRVIHHQRNHSTGTPRTEVGEIDTRAPFQSVRAAVNLFGAVATIKDKASLHSFQRQSSARSFSSSEGGARSLPSFKFKRQSSAISAFSSESGTVHSNAIDKETQLMSAEKELSKFKQRLEDAQTTKARALTDLETATQTLEELQNTTRTVTEATQALKERAKKLEEQSGEDDSTWRKESKQETEQYMIASDELHSVKQNLTKIRQDFDAALEAKSAAFQRAAEAQSTAKGHRDRASELQKEIGSTKDSIEQAKLATKRCKEAMAKTNQERESIVRESKLAKEEAEEKRRVLGKEHDRELTTSLEMELEELSAEIQVLQDEMGRAHELQMSSVKVISDELNEATKILQLVAQEESELRTWVASLRLELENVKKDKTEAEQQESRFVDLKVQLETAKRELGVQAESNQDENVSQLHQLTSETKEKILEAEESKRKSEEMKQEALTSKAAEKEAEKELRVAMTVLEDAKARESAAVDELRNVSAVCATDFGPASAKIRMSRKDYEVLRKKGKEAEKSGEKKVADVMFRVGVINASKSEADCKVEAAYKELEELQAAIDLALKQAEVSKAAQVAIESELQRWSQQEQEQEQEHEQVEERRLQTN